MVSAGVTWIKSRAGRARHFSLIFSATSVKSVISLFFNLEHFMLLSSDRFIGWHALTSDSEFKHDYNANTKIKNALAF